MSDENVELCRRYYEAWNAGGLDGTQDLRHPNMEVIDPPNFPDAGRHVGEAAIRERIASYREVGWDGQFRSPEFLDAGEEVVVVWKMKGRSPHGGGLPLELTFAHLCLFEGGRLRRVRQYLSRAEGLEAAGLPE
jgi:ketosteroid isomerase-like protein